MTSALRAIYRVNLGVKKTERVLVFTDRPEKDEALPQNELSRRLKLRDIALLTAETGKNLSKEVLFLEYPSTKSHGVEPPVKLWEAAFGKKAVSLLKKKKLFTPILAKKAKDEQLKEAEKIIKKFKSDAVDAVIALSNYSTTHTRFRDFLTRVKKARYASMPLFDISMLEGPMNIDWRGLEKRTRAISKIIEGAEAVGIKTPNGTSISFSIKGRKIMCDTGNLRRPGSGGNLPAGEVFLAPVEGTAEGTLVLEWAPTHELSSPITLIVSGGMVMDVSGKDPYAFKLREKLSERPENSNIAELGIGTNENAKRPDNILESEKILGTIHIALGDNSSFGGRIKTPFHQDFIFFKPTVRLIGKNGGKTVLMKNGKMQRIE
jgi:leucyl aminopeptidase (aminopeptidase T)